MTVKIVIIQVVSEGGINVNMKLSNIKNIDSIEKGIKLLNMRNNEVVIIEDIKDNTVKIKARINLTHYLL